jgi:glycosyltransferase involved in cell wall biosynthesis
MKILLVHNSYREPGGEDVVFEQERELLERAGHQLFVYRRSNHEVLNYQGLKQIRLIKEVAWREETKLEIARLLRHRKPELVHVHNTFMMISPSIYDACQDAGVPVVQTLHNYRLLCPAAAFFRNGKACEECVTHSLWRGIRYGCYRGSRSATATVALMLAVNRLRHTWADKIARYITLTNFAREKFVRSGLPASRVDIKPNFVHPDPGTNVETSKHVVFVGRLSQEKGLSTLLGAWQRLRPAPPLQVIGDGPLRTVMETQAKELGLSNVTFCGHLARNQMLALVRRAAFLVLPSDCYENFPMNIAEAFACGLPVICSRLGAMEEIVADGRTGLHFTPGDPEDLAQKVDWAWSHPRQMAEMGKEARREYETKYTAERNYSLLMEIYQRAISTGVACTASDSGSERFASHDILPTTLSRIARVRTEVGTCNPGQD